MIRRRPNWCISENIIKKYIICKINKSTDWHKKMWDILVSLVHRVSKFKLANVYFYNHKSYMYTSSSKNGPNYKLSKNVKRLKQIKFLEKKYKFWVFINFDNTKTTQTQNALYLYDQYSQRNSSIKDFIQMDMWTSHSIKRIASF